MKDARTRAEIWRYEREGRYDEVERRVIELLADFEDRGLRADSSLVVNAKMKLAAAYRLAQSPKRRSRYSYAELTRARR